MAEIRSLFQLDRDPNIDMFLRVMSGIAPQQGEGYGVGAESKVQVDQGVGVSRDLDKFRALNRDVKKVPPPTETINQGHDRRYRNGTMEYPRDFAPQVHDFIEEHWDTFPADLKDYLSGILQGPTPLKPEDYNILDEVSEEEALKRLRNMPPGTSLTSVRKIGIHQDDLALANRQLEQGYNNWWLENSQPILEYTKKWNDWNEKRLTALAMSETFSDGEPIVQVIPHDPTGKIIYGRPEGTDISYFNTETGITGRKPLRNIYKPPPPQIKVGDEPKWTLTPPPKAKDIEAVAQNMSMSRSHSP